MASIRCKITGCDLDDCGVCKRCKDASVAKHDWNDVDPDPDRPCYKKSECSRCGEARESPVHAWTPTPTDTPDGTGIEMKCSRCGLRI